MLLEFIGTIFLLPLSIAAVTSSGDQAHGILPLLTLQQIPRFELKCAGSACLLVGTLTNRYCLPVACTVLRVEELLFAVWWFPEMIKMGGTPKCEYDSFSM